jgi:hypothetical protein
MADFQHGGVDEGYPGTLTATRQKIKEQWQQHTRHEFNKARIAHQVREFALSVWQNLDQILCLEIAILRLMKMDQDGHNFALAQVGCATTAGTSGKLLLLPTGRKSLPEIIDSTEQFQ